MYRTRQAQGFVRELLLERDAMGVAGAPEVADEHDCLISPLLHQLHVAASAEAIQACFVRELKDRFGMSSGVERGRRPAKELSEWWSHRTSDAAKLK